MNHKEEIAGSKPLVIESEREKTISMKGEPIAASPIPAMSGGTITSGGSPASMSMTKPSKHIMPQAISFSPPPPARSMSSPEPYHAPSRSIPAISGSAMHPTPYVATANNTQDETESDSPPLSWFSWMQQTLIGADTPHKPVLPSEASTGNQKGYGFKQD